MPKNTAPLPDWERVLSSAARLQRILPDAVLVGGTASAIHAGHRFSRDADHVLTDLRHRIDDVLAELESVAGRKTARVQRPVQILGSLDGIETEVRQLIRDQPLETAVVDYRGMRITVPTAGDILRIEGMLIGESPLRQLQVQLANALPYDLEKNRTQRIQEPRSPLA